MEYIFDTHAHYDDEDFDEDAEWHILGLAEFSPNEQETIKNKIIENT